jgi:penicillin amidase
MQMGQSSSKLSKRITIGVSSLCLILVAIGVGLWWVIRGSLPNLDGTVAAKVGSIVEIERDQSGIVTVRSDNSSDLVFGLGYAHGQDRFFDMDLMRRSAAGELSVLIGEPTVKLDRARRQLGVREHVRSVLNRLPEAHQEELQAYTAGVNAGLNSLRNRPFPYLLLRSKPAPWTPEDSLLVGMAMYFDLQDAIGKKQIREARARERLGPEIAAFLFENGRAGSRPLTADPLPVLPPPTSGWPLSLATSTPPQPAPEEEMTGSNAFAVGTALTEDGRAILAVDMHLGLSVPNIWYRARLQLAGRFDAIGATLPGLPVIIVGTNGKVAWGFTNSYIDTLDLVRIDPTQDPAAIITSTEEIEIKGQPSQFVTRCSLHGFPLLSTDDDEWIAQWTGLHPDFLNLGILELLDADSLEDAISIAHMAGMPCQNMVVVDALGRIGWTLMGGIPQRSIDAPRLPLSNDTPWAWEGRLPASLTPTWIDPPSHRIWTANNRILGRQHASLLGDGGYSQQGRDTVIADALHTQTTLTEEDLLALQYSAQTRIFDRWIVWLGDLAESNAWKPATLPYPSLWEEVLSCDGTAAIESRAYLFLRVFRGFLADAVFGTLLAELGMPWNELAFTWDEPLYQILTTATGQSLDPYQSGWRHALDAAFAATVQHLESTFGDAASATWGARNRLQIQHPLSQAIPVVGTWLDMPSEPVAGDGFSPRAQGPAFGASQRLVVSPAHLDEAIFHMPAGQSGHFLSPFYSAGHRDWVEGRPSPLLPGPAVHTLLLRPRP